MLKLERSADGERIIVRLIGRVRSGHLGEIDVVRFTGRVREGRNPTPRLPALRPRVDLARRRTTMSELLDLFLHAHDVLEEPSCLGLI